jgi:hypothetical protein
LKETCCKTTTKSGDLLQDNNTEPPAVLGYGLADEIDPVEPDPEDATALAPVKVKEVPPAPPTLPARFPPAFGLPLPGCGFV